VSAADSVLVLIPAYNEACTISEVVERVRERILAVLVVDDGSTDDTGERARAAGADVIQCTRNLGKGAALNRGFEEARTRGFEAVITMDGDGQHAATDLPQFLEAFAQARYSVLIGNRMSNPASMPAIRRLTNRGMSWWLSRLMHQDVPDTQNGYRLYRLDALSSICVRSQRYDAESEILLHLAHRRVPIGSVPVTTVYGAETSQVHPLKDTWRFLKMLWRFHRGGGKSALDDPPEMR
jgi:glycosyltransferase involved in cell wall biosynthesis